jgi:hypothetical protein
LVVESCNYQKELDRGPAASCASGDAVRSIGQGQRRGSADRQTKPDFIAKMAISKGRGGPLLAARRREASKVTTGSQWELKELANYGR